MSRYTFGVNTAEDWIGDATAHCYGSLKAGANSGFSVTGFSVGLQDSEPVGTRYSLWRYSADGTGGATITPSGFSSRSPAAGTVAHNDYTTTDPTDSTNPIIIINGTTDVEMMRPRRWTLPNPRYPISEEPSSSTPLGIEATSWAITYSLTMSFAEDRPRNFGFSTMRGRRSRRPGFWSCGYANRNFEGLSTSPKNGGNSTSFNYVQPTDWPDSVYQLARQMNLLYGAVNYALTADVGVFTLTGNAAVLKTARVITAVLGTYVFTGKAAGLKRNYTLTATVSVFTLTGNAAVLKADRKLVTTVATFTLTGNTTGLKVARVLNTSVATFILTGNTVNLRRDYQIVTVVATFVLTGNTVGLGYQRNLPTTTGVFTLTGNAASLVAARKISTIVGVFVLTGNDATLTYTPSGGGNVTLTTSVGVFVLTGSNAQIYSSQTGTGTGFTLGWYKPLKTSQQAHLSSKAGWSI